MSKKTLPNMVTLTSFMRILSILVCILTIQNFLMVDDLSASDKKQVVAGAGPSTKLVALFMDLLAKTGVGQEYHFTVPQNSIKHAGGLRSTKKYIFGRTGRPLSNKEKSGGFEELFLGKMPIAFVAGRDSGMKRLSVGQICSIFTGKTKNWREVGGRDHEIVIFSREPTEALLKVLQKELPCMHRIANTKFIFNKDHHPDVS